MMSTRYARVVVVQNYSQMSHQILAFIAREFTNNTKQPTRSQELRSTEPIFMLLTCHGIQSNEKMHPKRVLRVKRVSSVWGVMRCTRGRERELFWQMSSTYYLYRTSRPTLFDDASGGQSAGQKDCLVMFVGKTHRRALSHCPLPI